MKQIVVLLICFLSGILALDFQIIPNNRIVGGNNVSIIENGWQVSVQLFGNHYCGGVLISENWILTAAHCIEKETNVDKRFTVRVGSDLQNQGGRVYKITEAFIHPKFDQLELDFDVALLRVSNPIYFTACSVRTIRLLDKGEETPAGSLLKVTGWGARISGGTIIPELRGAEISLIDRKTCNEIFGPNNGISENMLCAGFLEGGVDACQGDSGGPLVDSKRNLVGIVSWGRGCGNSNSPGVYTSIAASEIRKFIKLHTNI